MYVCVYVCALIRPSVSFLLLKLFRDIFCTFDLDGVFLFSYPLFIDFASKQRHCEDLLKCLRMLSNTLEKEEWGEKRMLVSFEGNLALLI